MTTDADLTRLYVSLEVSESFAGVLTEAMRAMTEARFLLADQSSRSRMTPWTTRREALAVLERGIAEARYALNLTDEEPA